MTGEAFGSAAELAKLCSWLRSTGSPKSRIERAEFRFEAIEPSAFPHEDFAIVR